jgi:chemotaxis protein methyltransferase CheR
MKKTETGIPDTELSKISELIAERTGLHFPVNRLHDLERGICSAAREFGFKDAESCIRWLLSSPLSKEQIEVLASYLTVGETYFFREKKSFEMLEKHLLPDLIRSRQGNEKSLRIWSAGCCTGEEPYSIAILLSKMIPDIKDWNITILSTDINPRFLKKASAGVYTDWSFRDTPLAIKERYFKRTKEGRFEILPSIKKMVTFSYQNLVEDSYPSLLNNTNAMDIIFCRNVLMYFDHEYQRKVIQNLYRCLVDGGWLIVSPSETSHVLFSQFVTFNFPGAILYRKAVAGDKIQVSGFEMQDASFKSKDASYKMQEIIPPSHEYEFIPEPTQEIVSPEPEKAEEIEETRSEEPQQGSYLEALELYKKGRYTEVIKKVEDLFSKNEETSMAMGLLIRAFANQGRLSEASEWCNKAIDANKLDPSLHYLLATIFQEQGAIDEAIKSLKRALYINPDFVLAYFTLGNLNFSQNKFKESEKHYENALALLHDYRNDEILLESEGINAGRLKEIIRLMIVV